MDTLLYKRRVIVRHILRGKEVSTTGTLTGYTAEQLELTIHPYMGYSGGLIICIPHSAVRSIKLAEQS